MQTKLSTGDSTAAGYEGMIAEAINPFGQIAGRTADDQTPRAFFYGDGQSVLLPLLPGANTGIAHALHQSEPGKVVGYNYNSATGNPPWTAVYWDGNSAPVALNLPMSYSMANDINDLGQIVGPMGLTSH